VQPIATLDGFLRAPIGRYFIGRRYLVWCDRPALAGCHLHGRLERDDLVELSRFMRWRAAAAGMAVPFDIVSDCRRVDALDAAGYRYMAQSFRAHLDALSTIVRRHAFIHAGGFLGAVMSGVLALASQERRWREFESFEPALAWLGAPALAGEVAALIDRLVDATPSLVALRELLASRRRPTRLVDAARLLGRSERSLQRDLLAAGSSFRTELDRARVEAATALLADPERKLAAIAHDVGCSSASHLSRLFRRFLGHPPSHLRAERSRSRR